MTHISCSTSGHSWRAEFQRLEGAYAPGTMRSYYSDVQAFVDWCEARDLAPFPSDVETVCTFIEDEGKEKAIVYLTNPGRNPISRA